MRFWFLVSLSFNFLLCSAQNINKKEVKLVVDSFIEALNTRNTEKIQELLDGSAGLLTVFYDGTKSILTAESIEMFIGSLEKGESKIWQEELINYKINCSEALATVWSDYNFYLNGKLHHCGENAFQLYKSPKGWKIIQITDSRYKLGACQDKNPLNKYENKAVLIKFIDTWHLNASEAKFDEYFNAISENGIYIGTDPQEYWTKQEYREWVSKTLKPNNGFHFEIIDRNIFFNDEEDIAWFNEKLKTDMGVCHATGIATNTRSGWKINYYQLSVTVPNDLLKPFLELKKSYKDKINE